jgi:hypothetical protein
MSLFEFGQTAVIPECGVVRCVELTRRVGRRRRVLCIGDDDLLSPVLARMGHQVTVVDVDGLLIEFLGRAALHEGVKLDVRALDVLAPFPEDLCSAFDVVLTDPMSFESCLEAFLSRAAVAVRPGGTVFTCVHPLARNTLRRLWPRLPFDLEDAMYEVSTYYYAGYVENWYRSDFYMLRRTAREPRIPATATIPFADIIAGTLDDRLHAFGSIKVNPLRKASWETVRHVMEAWSKVFAAHVVDTHVVDAGEQGHFYVSLKEGGHVAVAFDKARSTVAWDLFPFSERMDGSLVAAFASAVQVASLLSFQAIAPDLAVPTVVVPTRPRTRGKSHPRVPLHSAR